MSKRRPKRPPLGTYGNDKYSVSLNDELRSSPAYAVLTFAERVVLLDWLRAYATVSGWDHFGVPDGVTYSWSQCRERVSDRVFYDAIKRLHAVGFLDAPPEIQEHRVGAPRFYQPSTRWRKYKPTVSEQAKLQTFDTTKAARIKAQKARRADAREKLRKRQNPHDEKSGTRHDEKSGTRSAPTRRKVVYPRPKSAPADTTLSRVLDHIPGGDADLRNAV